VVGLDTINDYYDINLKICTPEGLVSRVKMQRIIQLCASETNPILLDLHTHESGRSRDNAQVFGNDKFET